MKAAIYEADWFGTTSAGASVVKYAKGRAYPITEETAGHIAQGHAREVDVPDDPVTAAQKAAKAAELAQKAQEKAAEAESLAKAAAEMKEAADAAAAEEKAAAEAAAAEEAVRAASDSPDGNLFKPVAEVQADAAAGSVAASVKTE